MLRSWVRRAGVWMGGPFRRSAVPPGGPDELTPTETMRRLLMFGDVAASADGPSLPFLDTAPLTHHVDEDR